MREERERESRIKQPGARGEGGWFDLNGGNILRNTFPLSEEMDRGVFTLDMHKHTITIQRIDVYPPSDSSHNAHLPQLAMSGEVSSGFTPKQLTFGVDHHHHPTRPSDGTCDRNRQTCS